MNIIFDFQKKHSLNPDGLIGKNTLKKMKKIFKIKSKESFAHFIGQLAHETNNFKSTSESFNYSVKGLINTFSYYKKHKHLAREHGRTGAKKANQELIANTVYNDSNRSSKYKLGNVQPGDGWKFRGRGSIMITGRSNYEAFFRWMKLPIDTDPGTVESLYYWDAAKWFFKVNNIWKHTNEVNDVSILKITKMINGGVNGLSHRKALTYKFYKYIA